MSASIFVPFDEVCVVAEGIIEERWSSDSDDSESSSENGDERQIGTAMTIRNSSKFGRNPNCWS